MKTENYQLIVQTNMYAGNFERELCAYMTGHTGECGVGDDLVEADITERFYGKIDEMPDDHGTLRPVALDETNANNLIIFLNAPLSAEDIGFLTERAIKFESERPYEYLDKDFKFLGFKHVRITNYSTVEEI